MKFEYINNETLNNIYNNNNYKSCLGVLSNINILNENERCFGEVKLLINMKFVKKIDVGNIIEFYPNYVKWSSTNFDNNGQTIHILSIYNCREFKANMKMKVVVNILTSKEIEGKRIYNEDKEYIYLNWNQFLMRRLIEKFKDYRYDEIAGCQNMGDMMFRGEGYYKALNSTAKQYRIKHNRLKTLYSHWKTAIRVIEDEWHKIELRTFKNDLNKQQVKQLMDKFKEKQNASIIDMSEFKRLHKVEFK